jgi:hypothetical protein
MRNKEADKDMKPDHQSTGRAKRGIDSVPLAVYKLEEN